MRQDGDSVQVNTVVPKDLGLWLESKRAAYQEEHGVGISMSGIIRLLLAKAKRSEESPVKPNGTPPKRKDIPK